MVDFCVRLMIPTFIGAQIDMKKWWFVIFLIGYGAAALGLGAWVCWRIINPSWLEEFNFLTVPNLLSAYDNQREDIMRGKKDYFEFSPDKKYIAFLADTSDETRSSYNALNVYDPSTRKEKTLLIDNYRLSGFVWINNNTVRAYRNAGTGVRVYHDIDVRSSETLIADNQPDEGINFWTPDAEYVQRAKDYAEAWRVYAGVD